MKELVSYLYFNLLYIYVYFKAHKSLSNLDANVHIYVEV